MKLKNFLILYQFFYFSGCQTIKEKSDEVAEKENKKLDNLLENKLMN